MATILDRDSFYDEGRFTVAMKEGIRLVYSVGRFRLKKTKGAQCTKCDKFAIDESLLKLFCYCSQN